MTEEYQFAAIEGSEDDFMKTAKKSMARVEKQKNIKLGPIKYSREKIKRGLCHLAVAKVVE